MIEELKDASGEDVLRINALRAVLLGHAEVPHAECHIYCYRDVWGGVRISEVDFTVKTEVGMAGSSWMASDLDAAAPLYACEQYLCHCLFPVEDHGASMVYDPEQEARRAVIYNCFTHDYNALPEWEDRTRNPLSKEQA